MSDSRSRFEAWWDKDDLTNSGPWAPDTPIQFAWDAYQAGLAEGRAESARAAVDTINCYSIVGDRSKEMTTILYRGNELGEILDADGQVIGRVVSVEASDYYYEWDTGFGLRRSFSAAPYNGMPPNRSMPLLSAATVDIAAAVVRVPDEVAAAVKRCVEIVRKWEYYGTYQSDAIKAEFPEVTE